MEGASKGLSNRRGWLGMQLRRLGNVAICLCWDGIARQRGKRKSLRGLLALDGVKTQRKKREFCFCDESRGLKQHTGTQWRLEKVTYTQRQKR